MTKYIDGFVIPIKRANVPAYRRIATRACKVWMKHGALDYFECVGEELSNQCGWTFPRMCKLKSDETAIFAYIVYRSKAHRNAVNEKVMKDPLMTGMIKKTMPFDMKRFAWGGFKVLVEARSQ